MSSIRVFLVLVILAVITLFYFVAALRGYQSGMDEAARLFDGQLLDTARLIAGIHDGSVLDYEDSNVAFQIWNRDKLLAASGNAPEFTMCAPESGSCFSNFGGHRWRTVAYNDAATGNWILVAEQTESRFALAENVVLEMLYPALAGLPVVGFLIWLIVSSGLRPLRKLAQSFAGKQPDDLSPVTISAPRRELAQIVASINGLLSRLESSLAREKQFASDAAHELRTPISALKLQVFNLAHEPGIDEELIGETERSVLRLEHIVEQILNLYRSAPDRHSFPFESLDLGDLSRDVLAETYPVFDTKDLHLEFSGDACVVSGDRFALKTLLQNLLSNAIKYTPRRGSIRVTVNQEGNHARLCVEDSGPGIEPDQREAVFERFYRAGRDGHPPVEPGCGLGLAIVKRLVDLHGGRIDVGPSAFDTGAAFTIWIPLAREQAPPGERGWRKKVHASG